MSEIIFDVLEDSPETLGSLAILLPRIRFVGLDVSDFALMELPALAMAAAGGDTEHVSGDLAMQLGSLWFFASDNDVGMNVTYDGWMVPYLPGLTFYGAAFSGFTPNHGELIINLPAPTFAAGGFTGNIGSLVATLPHLRLFALEAAGNWGFWELPQQEFSGYDLTTTPVNYIRAIQTPGYSMIYVSNNFHATIRETFTVGPELTPTLIVMISERIRLTGSPLPSRTRRVAMTEGIAFEEAMALGWYITLAEDLILSGTVAGQLHRLAVIADTLHAVGSVATKMDAYAALASVVAINDLTATGWKVGAIDSLAFQDVLAGKLNAIMRLLDSAGFADTPGAAMRLVAIASETLVIDDNISTSLEAFEQLADGVIFYATIRLGDSEYVGWVLTKGGAASKYLNYPFNGFVEFPRGSRRYYGTADTGLHLLEGQDDNGKDIDGYIKTAMIDFGTGKKKRVPEAYIAFRGVGLTQAVLRVITTNESNEQLESVYTATIPAGDALHNGRIKIGRGIKSTYWQFVLANVDGKDLDLDQLAFRPVILDRRI
jgi:hypothetical protein